MRHPGIKAYLAVLLHHEDLARKLVESLIDQLDAVHYLRVNGKLTEVPDNEARGRAQDTLLKLLGLLK